MTMRRILVAILLWLCPLCLLAGPAQPQPVSYTQPDGSTITVRLVGDEFHHYMTTLDGTRLEVATDGYLRPAATAQDGEALRRAAVRRAAASARFQSARRATSWSGQQRFLVILVSFKDLRFTTPASVFEDLLNKEGYSDNGATGSAYDYLYENSMGTFRPEFDVYGPVTLSNNESYYGSNDPYTDAHSAEGFLEACSLLDSEIDFSQYDLDGDGYVENISFFYAGYAESAGAPAATLWPHAGFLESSVGSGGIVTNSFDGVKVDYYACASEFKGTSGTQKAGIGPFLHEFGHVMGLPDLYDTSGTVLFGPPTMYSFSLMSKGSYNNDSRTPPYLCAVERMLLGWMDEPEALSGSGYTALRSIGYNEALKIETDVEGEYFMLECRDGSGWDAGLSESGLMVYHVDQSSNIVEGSTTAATLWDDFIHNNTINAHSSHPCCYVVTSASSLFGVSSYLFPGKSNVTTIGGFSSWSGASVGMPLRGITFTCDQVMFAYGNALYDAGINAIANPGRGVYERGEEFPLVLTPSSHAPSSVSWYYDDAPVSGSSVTLSSGTHTIKAVLSFTKSTASETLEQVVTVR